MDRHKLEEFKKFHEIEIILINDCSNDPIQKITAGLSKQLQWYHAVMPYSNGDYVVIIDDDGQNN